MKNYIILFALTMALIWSCAKEKSEIDLNVSVYIDEYEGYHVKDLLVYDENNVNSAYFRIYSKNEGLLMNFVESNNFSLGTFDDKKVVEMKKSGIGFDTEFKETNPEKLHLDLSNYDLESEVITIEFVTENLRDGEGGFYLKSEKAETNKSNNSIPGYENTNVALRYVSNSPHNFLGVFSLLDVAPNWPLAEVQFKVGIIAPWQEYYQHGAVLRVVLDDPYHARLSNPWNFYRVAFLMRRHLAATNISHNDSYIIAYTWEGYRGRHCEIGSFDTRNCYVATAPQGTQAFMYPNNRGHLYYTPVNGNQCPLPGSTFDTANCYVAAIPSNTTGFIIDNKLMYVRPSMITDLHID